MRALCTIAAILVTGVIYAQNEGKVRWSPEFSAKVYVSIYHSSCEISAGVRVDDNVFGLGSGCGSEYWDPYPANIKLIPVYGFYRRYFPLGKKKRFLLFGEATLGGESVYEISCGRPDVQFKSTPYWRWRVRLTPGIALRLFGNTNIYLAPTWAFLDANKPLPGVTAALNVGF